MEIFYQIIKKPLGHAVGNREAADFAFYQIFDKITKFLVFKIKECNERYSKKS
jgi:hypothetical protein